MVLKIWISADSHQNNRITIKKEYPISLVQFKYTAVDFTFTLTFISLKKVICMGFYSNLQAQDKYSSIVVAFLVPPAEISNKFLLE